MAERTGEVVDAVLERQQHRFAGVARAFGKEDERVTGGERGAHLRQRVAAAGAGSAGVAPDHEGVEHVAADETAQG